MWFPIAEAISFRSSTHEIQSQTQIHQSCQAYHPRPIKVTPQRIPSLWGRMMLVYLRALVDLDCRIPCQVQYPPTSGNFDISHEIRSPAFQPCLQTFESSKAFETHETKGAWAHSSACVKIFMESRDLKSSKDHPKRCCLLESVLTEGLWEASGMVRFSKPRENSKS